MQTAISLQDELALPAVAVPQAEASGPAPWIFGALFLLALVGVYEVRRRSVLRARTLGLAAAPAAPRRPATSAEAPSALPDSRIERWLITAGLEGEGMRTKFFLWVAGAALLGAFLALILESSGWNERAVVWIEEIPGGIADIFVPVMGIAPWLLAALVALLPIAWIRRRRKARAAEVERDMPSVLSLLATLVESGLGFDAATRRVEQSLGPDRVLADELARVRAGALAGLTRTSAIRAMAQRLDVPSMTTFTSALIHAENQGASVGETLRRQAVDLWARRREEAIQSAQTLPTKLAFPLVLCFLPGIFVWTFGPAVAEFIRLAENTIRGGS